MQTKAGNPRTGWLRPDQVLAFIGRFLFPWHVAPVEAPYFVAMMGGGLLHIRSLAAARSAEEMRVAARASIGAARVAAMPPQPRGAVAQ